MLIKREKQGKRILLATAALVFAAVMQCEMTVQAAECLQSASVDMIVQQQAVSDNTWKNSSVSDNAVVIGSVSDNSALSTLSGRKTVDNVQNTDNLQMIENGEEVKGPETREEDAEEGKELEGTEENNELKEAVEGTEAGITPVLTVDSGQLQTLNYKDGILTDWQQINEALRTLSADSLTNPDAGGESLVLQLQNVSNVPAGIKDCIASGDSGYTKYLHCNIGYGASLVFNGAFDNSGFNGISNASVTVDSEKRGKKSMAVTVKFASHEDMGTIASLHVNLPQCAKGTKVSVYAETVSVDADGNVTVGENACIGNTKADENGNVEVLIQSTANYMFVYKAAKD